MRSTRRPTGPGVQAAAAALEAGGLVVYPTDTLLGIAARATERRAVERLARVKGRSAAQPISVAVSSTEEVDALADLSPAARRFVRRHLPGPYTVLVRPSDHARVALAPSILANPAAVGLRVPDHPVARELARRVGPITATSANHHGEPPARTVPECRRLFGGDIAVYLPAVPAPSGRPSTLVDLTGSAPRAVRRR